MNEGPFTCKLLKLLRQAMPYAVVLKHNDAMTSGIPDFSVSRAGRTIWFEVKLSTAAPKKMFEPIQVETLRRLWGRYIIYDQKERTCITFPAEYVPFKEFSLLECVPYKIENLVIYIKELF